MTSRAAGNEATGKTRPRAYWIGAGLALAVLAGLTSWACGGSSASNTGADAGTTTTALTEGQALQILISANRGEVQAGQLAQSKATNPAVRTFANQMVNEHTAALQRLQSLIAGGTGGTGGTADAGTQGPGGTMDAGTGPTGATGATGATGTTGGTTATGGTGGTSGTGADGGMTGSADAGTGGSGGSGTLTPEPSPDSQQLDQQVSQTLATLQNLSGDSFDKAYVDSQITMHANVLQLFNKLNSGVITTQALVTEIQSETTTVQAHLQQACQLQATLLQGGADAGVADGGTGTTGTTGGSGGSGTSLNPACSGGTGGSGANAGIGGTTGTGDTGGTTGTGGSPDAGVVTFP